MILHVAIRIAIMAAASAAAAAAWLLFGREISLLADSVLPRPASPRPVGPMLIEFDPAGISSRFVLGSINWSFSWPSRPWPAEMKIIPDDRGRLLLAVGDRWFTFGPIRKFWNDPAKPQYEFVPEEGDVVSFTDRIGRLAWPTPFTYDILGGSVPKWKRLVYYRLRWTKPSGAMLEVIWRSEHWFYRTSGWADTWQNRLTRVRVHAGPIEKAAAAHLRGTKGWDPSQYRLEVVSTTPGHTLLRAIHSDDYSAKQPCGGKSVTLDVDERSRKVISESAFQ